MSSSEYNCEYFGQPRIMAFRPSDLHINNHRSRFLKGYIEVIRDDAGNILSVRNILKDTRDISDSVDDEKSFHTGIHFTDAKNIHMLAKPGDKLFLVTIPEDT
jgi:hypothetical protein